MNWYKIAQRKNRFRELIKGFTAGSLIGLFFYIGVNNLLDAEKKFIENPQEVTNAIQIVQQEESSQVNEPIPSKEINQPISIYNDEYLKDIIKRHEGYRNKVYFDIMGHPTIGIGFNLDRVDVKYDIAKLGENIEEILKGKELTDSQINYLFQNDLETAKEDASSFLPNFENYPEEVKVILVDMAFNMGRHKLAQFVKFREALLNQDYERASKEMIDSDWYKQVGNRSRELVSLMEGV